MTRTSMYFAVLLMCFLFLTGCANQKKVPSFAFAQPEQGVTAPHPDELERGGGVITVFTAIMPAQFLVEVQQGVKGVWPLVAGHMMDEKASIEDGFCYAVESKAFGKNPWGIVPMECAIVGKKIDFAQYKFALVNKDGGVWISAPAGGNMIDDRSWSFEKFEDDFDHRKEVLGKVGKTLKEIDQFWIEQFARLGLEIDGDVREITISQHSQEWLEFRASFISEMGYELTLPNGDNVVSSVSRDEMIGLLSRNPRITKWQKFTSRLAIPLGTPEVIVFGTASSILNGGIAAMIDSEWQSRVARGSGQYRDQAEQMAYLMQKIQESQADVMRYKYYFAKNK